MPKHTKKKIRKRGKKAAKKRMKAKRKAKKERGMLAGWLMAIVGEAEHEGFFSFDDVADVAKTLNPKAKRYTEKEWRKGGGPLI